MSDLPDTPESGEVIWIDFSPTMGHDQDGRRPSLVLSAREFNELTGRALLVPITNRDRGWPFHIPLGPGEPVSGVAMVDEARLLDWRSRRFTRTGLASELLIYRVRRTFARIAGLP